MNTDPDPPYASYAGLVLTLITGLVAVNELAKRAGRPPVELSAFDLVALGGATFKAARTLTDDEVTSFVRAPFVDRAYDGEDEEPVGEGLRQAIGELVTCSRCIGMWAAGGLAATQLLAPRFGRLLVWSLNGAALNDFLQAGFATLTSKANALEQEAS